MFQLKSLTGNVFVSLSFNSDSVVVSDSMMDDEMEMNREAKDLPTCQRGSSSRGRVF